jgi:hypothetical protein
MKSVEKWGSVGNDVKRALLKMAIMDDFTFIINNSSFISWLVGGDNKLQVNKSVYYLWIVDHVLYNQMKLLIKSTWKRKTKGFFFANAFAVA